MPKSQGAFPSFPLGADDNIKRKLIAEFLQTEYDIQVVKTVEELLKNQLIEAVDEDYILELKEGISEYSGVSLLDILNHLRTEYGPMTDTVFKALMKRFREAPDMNLPIDKYFRKQEECRLLSQDADDPITDKGMVVQLTTHMGETGLVNKSVTKFKKQPDQADKTWAKGKVWFRKALKELREEAKLAGQDVSFQANNVRFAPDTKKDNDEATLDARDEIAGQMRDSFSSLAQAAVAKADTIDAHAATIASLTKTVAELTQTNKQLVKALAAAKAAPPMVKPPPGFGNTPHSTGHAVNDMGNSCPTIKWRADSRWQFVNPQYCKACNHMVKHVPDDCSLKPGNEAIKAEINERRRRGKGPRRGGPRAGE